MPKNWSWITGHLPILQKFIDKLPPDANVNLALADLCMEFKDTEIFLMDYWPVYPPLFLVHSPEVAMRVSTKLNLAKTEQIGKSLLPITGGQSLISMNGDEWKMRRNLFNPGFSATSMMDNVPHIVDYVMVFSELLRDKAGKGIVYLDDLTTRLTMDIIIKVAMSVFSYFWLLMLTVRQRCRPRLSTLRECIGNCAWIHYSMALLLGSSHSDESAPALHPVVLWSYHGYIYSQ